jgi:hypothetical protein
LGGKGNNFPIENCAAFAKIRQTLDIARFREQRRVIY